jgi:hypothetical protein
MLLVCLVKRFQFAFGFQMPFHVGNVRMVTAVALELVQNLDEDAQNQIASGRAAVVGFSIDVEENHIGVGGDRSFDVSEEHRVFDFALEEVDSELLLAVACVLAVAKQVRQDLEEVGFTGSKEAGDPDPHFACRIRILTLIDCLQIPINELSEVLVEFLGNNELIEFLPNGGVVELIRFHDTVDRSKDIAFE